MYIIEYRKELFKKKKNIIIIDFIFILIIKEIGKYYRYKYKNF